MEKFQEIEYPQLTMDGSIHRDTNGDPVFRKSNDIVRRDPGSAAAHLELHRKLDYIIKLLDRIYERADNP